MKFVFFISPNNNKPTKYNGGIFPVCTKSEWQGPKVLGKPSPKPMIFCKCFKGWGHFPCKNLCCQKFMSPKTARFWCLYKVPCLQNTPHSQTHWWWTNKWGGEECSRRGNHQRRVTLGDELVLVGGIGEGGCSTDDEWGSCYWSSTIKASSSKY